MLSWQKDLTALLDESGLSQNLIDDLVLESIHQIHQQQEQVGAACEVLDESYRLKSSHSSPQTLPLSGIPFSVKETIGLKGHSITAGSLRMPPIDCDEDAAVVKLLKQKGAVPVARTNLPELAMCYDSDNLRFGRTRNPLNAEFSAGGSSGGEAALLATGATLFGIGSDIGGSIRYPAHCCGVVGFKPASGAVDKSGTFPAIEGLFTDSFLAIGPFARSVRDAQLIYDIIARHPVIAQSRHQPRMIVPADMPLSVENQSIDSAWKTAANALRASRYKTSEQTKLDYYNLYQDYLKLVVADFYPLMWRALTDQDGQALKPLSEMWRHLRGQPQVHPYLFWPLLLMPLIKPGLKRQQLAKQRVLEAREQVRELLGKDGVLVVPTCGALAMHHGRASWRINRPWLQKAFVPLLIMNLLDLPAISIPARRFQDPLSGLMPGIMIAAAPGAEDLLFASARLVENAFQLSVADREVAHNCLQNADFCLGMRTLPA